MILEGDEDSSWCLLKCLFDLHVSAAKLLKQSINRNQNIIEEQKNFYSSHSSAILTLPIENKEKKEVKLSNSNSNLNLIVASESLKNDSIFVPEDERWSAKMNSLHNVKADVPRGNGNNIVKSSSNKENSISGLQSRSLLDETDKEVRSTLDPSHVIHSTQKMNGPYPPLMRLKEEVRNSPKLSSSSAVLRDSQNRNYSKKNSDNLSGCSNIKNMSNFDCDNTDNNSSDYKNGGNKFNDTSRYHDNCYHYHEYSS